MELRFCEPELICNESNSNTAASHSYHIIIMICFAISEDVSTAQATAKTHFCSRTHATTNMSKQARHVLQELTKKNTLAFIKTLFGIKQYNNNQTPPDVSLWDQQSVASVLLGKGGSFHERALRRQSYWPLLPAQRGTLLSEFLLHALEFPPPLLYNSDSWAAVTCWGCWPLPTAPHCLPALCSSMHSWLIHPPCWRTIPTREFCSKQSQWEWSL